MEILKIHEINPQKRLIEKACETLQAGGVILYPTDTVYALGCDIRKKNTIEKIYRIKKIDKKKPLSIILPDISKMSEYVKFVSNDAFRIMKKAFPGPYTFIFKASKLVPELLITNQKTIGVRIPDNKIALELVKTLDSPILSTSVNTPEGDYVIDPENLEKELRNQIDLIIDVGIKSSNPSTVVDFSNGNIDIIRKGKGELFFL
jgi:tRNA threonylcarbamoyl adenosine modification protein (Sua5/YciO/YrdC/YwlC family)